MLKYRKFISLTDDEIKLIVKDMFHPESINYIEKDKKYDEIKVGISTKWYSTDNDDNEEEALSEKPLPSQGDEIILGEDEITADFQILAKDIDLYKKFLFSLGINDLFKDNPYLNNKIEYINGVLIKK